MQIKYYSNNTYKYYSSSIIHASEPDCEAAKVTTLSKVIPSMYFDIIILCVSMVLLIIRCYYACFV